MVQPLLLWIPEMMTSLLIITLTTRACPPPAPRVLVTHWASTLTDCHLPGQGSRTTHLLSLILEIHLKFHPACRRRSLVTRTLVHSALSQPLSISHTTPQFHTPPTGRPLVPHSLSHPWRVLGKVCLISLASLVISSPSVLVHTGNQSLEEKNGP